MRYDSQMLGVPIENVGSISALGEVDPAFRPVTQASYAASWAPGEAKVCLDLGCGERVTSERFIGVDQYVGDWVGGKGPHRSTPDIVADIRTLPFPDESVDYIVSIHSLEHFRHPWVIIPEWSRVLKVGGRLVVIVPDYRYTYSCMQPDQKRARKFEGHKRDYTLAGLCVDMAGFPELEIIDARVVCPCFSVGIALEKVQS